MIKKLVGMAGMILALAVGTRAAIIGGDVIAIDFGATAPADANWNQISASALSIGNLQRLSDGALTGIGVTVTTSANFGNYIKNAVPSDSSLGATDVSIYADHLAANDLTAPDLITVTYTGLDDSLSYTLTGGMARSGTTTAFEQTYTVGGADYDYTGSSGVDAYAEYTGLSSSGGVLTFTVSDYTDSDLASISQITLTAVEVPQDGASLRLVPGALSLDLVGPDTTFGDIITVSYIAGALSSGDIKIIWLVTDAGFSAVATDPIMGVSNNEEDIIVTFDNESIGLANGEQTNSTLEVTWTEIGTSVTNTETIALDVTYDKHGDLARFWTIALDFGDTPAANYFNDISANGTYSSLVRLSDGHSVSGISVKVTGASFYKSDGPNDSLTGLSADYDVSNVTDWAGDTDTWTVMFYGLDDSLVYDIEGVIGGFTDNANTDTIFLQAGTRTNMFNPVTASANPRIARIEGVRSFGGVLEIAAKPGSKTPVLSVLTVTAVAGSTNDVIVVPNIVDITVGSESDVALNLEHAGTNYVVQQSDDLQRFSAVDYEVEGADNDSVLLSGSENVDPDGDGNSFFRLNRRPNFVIIFADDQGYQDLGCFGSPDILTPRIDAMASEGIRFTSFYAQTVCGPSRDSLMTGCYPLRTATPDARSVVHCRLAHTEVTLAEILKEVGYTTAAFGKWDLGGHSQTTYDPDYLPLAQGFDYFLGTSGSNDGTVNIIENTTRIETGADMSGLTERYTDAAISFIQNNTDRPFFVYLAHTMPHVDLAVSDDFLGTSAGGLYGDVIEELDWNVGRILDTLAGEGLDSNTYVIYMSDNGPWYLGNSSGHVNEYGGVAEAEAMGGSALPLRGDKVTSWEGGFRVPCVMRAPGRIPAGTVCDEITSTQDIMPSIAKLAGATVPTDRVIDGVDITPLMQGVSDAATSREVFYYYVRNDLHAVRVGKWKLHVARDADSTWARYYRDGDLFNIPSPMLFDLEADIGETNDVAAANPSVVSNLLEYIEFARTDIGDGVLIGENAR
ncbi:sulfatase [Pontiellaceae bacterium B1224]|nr:sulfatase [Pontiellaceae bacterium B1224]